VLSNTISLSVVWVGNHQIGVIYHSRRDRGRVDGSEVSSLVTREDYWPLLRDARIRKGTCRRQIVIEEHVDYAMFDAFDSRSGLRTCKTL
jgi:hypothetical protein